MKPTDWIKFIMEEINHGVNYTHLKLGASCFNDNTCITRCRNVEVLSPQALISAVPAVLY